MKALKAVGPLYSIGVGSFYVVKATAGMGLEPCRYSLIEQAVKLLYWFVWLYRPVQRGCGWTPGRRLRRWIVIININAMAGKEQPEGRGNERRHYRSSLDFVESGFRACWQNAQDLVAASKTLLDTDLHALALSLAVLALEELAKLSAIDVLLFARPEDEKELLFRKALKSHSAKLAMFEAFPFFIISLSVSDSRHRKDTAFDNAVPIMIQLMRDDRDAVQAYLKKPGYTGLDTKKQMGFYVNQMDGDMVPPRKAIDAKFAKAVHQLAWRATTSVDFLLKGGNLERYIDSARKVRSQLSERDHQELERMGKAGFEALFDTSGA